MDIPKKDVISFLLKETLQGGEARSQRELSDMLNRRLRKSSPGYAISGKRARSIALDTPGIGVKIHTRKGRLPKRCPVCGHTLRKTYTRNLRGRKLPLRVSCKICPYRGSGGSWIPRRYEFRAR
jgi:predicted RNA-binding Zn-ribbon protein involved in translation (DUF1610 family)